ncbi:MAG: helix-turn-helix transcriptional regulator [Desulfovibrio sp.]|jgi:transcriptional regulator with XRE-family HTH domain|nr:helix-turn-helix transcriptional regulator [Desulfovibrio sp.]
MKKVQGLPKAFGKVIAEARARQGMSQEQLAEAIDSTNVYISLLENGQRQPSLNATILIACSLGIRPEELLGQVCSLLNSKDILSNE